MKKRLNLISFLILLLIVLSLFPITISAQSSKQPFNKDNAETYSDNLNQVLTLMKTESGRDSVNTAISKTTPEIKNNILQELAVKISKDKISALNTGSWMSKITNAADSLAKTITGKPETKETKELIQLEKLTGFGSSKLKFYNDKLVGDGKVFLNIDKIPNGVIEIEYNEKDAKFILRFKGNEKSKYGGEVSIESGTIEDNKIIDKNKREIEFSWNSLNEITSKISVDKNGVIILEGKAEIKFNGKTFSLNNKIPELFIPYIRSFLEKDSLWQKAIVEIVDDAHFKVSGYAKVASENAVARTFGEKATDVIFKSGDFSQLSKYIQLDGNKINIGNKNGNRFSDFIDLELSKSIKDSAGKDASYEIKGNGKGIFIENGKRLYEINGENTKTLKKVQEGGFSLKVLNELNGGTLEDEGDVARIGNLVLISEVTKKESGFETVRIRTAFSESYKDLPDGLEQKPEEFKKAIEELPKKIEIETLLNVPYLLRSKHPQYINGQDLYNKFFGEDSSSPGYVKMFRDQGFSFTSSEENALKEVLKTALKYDPDSGGTGIILPKGSKVYITISESPNVEIVPNIGTFDNPVYSMTQEIKITDQNAVRALRKYNSYSLIANDPSIPGYDPTNGIKSSIDVLRKEYNNRKQCQNCFFRSQ